MGWSQNGVNSPEIGRAREVPFGLLKATSGKTRTTSRLGPSQNHLERDSPGRLLAGVPVNSSGGRWFELPDAPRFY